MDGKSVQETVGTQPAKLSIWRSNQLLEVQAPVTGLKVEPKLGTRTVGQLGFQPLPGQGPRISIGESFKQGSQMIVSYFAQIGGLFSRPKELGENLGGPVGIFQILDKMGKLPALYYFNTLASLSLSLAIFNLLPVPVLDGGHMLLLTVEVLRRRRLEPETQRAVAMVGMALIGVLFVVIMFKDIWRAL
jgi:regulator of sigma E protease